VNAAEIPAPARSAQQRASNPERSAWVSANAGSGKTHVLVQRVLRLLLACAPPSRILCLTFTKAAAANMSARVFRELAKWTRLKDEILEQEIVDLGAPAPDATELSFARRLFARTIETPGGLKIQTIHAFCERVLHIFPFEANVPAGFRVVEQREAADLLELARKEAFEQAQTAGDLASSIERIAKITSADRFDDLLTSTLKRAEEIAAWGDADSYADELRRRLGLKPEETEASLREQMLEGAGGPKRWRAWAAKLLDGSKTDKDRAETLLRAAGATDPELALDAYLEAFFTQNGTSVVKMANKPVAGRFPDLLGELDAEQERLEGLRDRLRSAEAVARSRALAQVAEAVLARYARLKNDRGFLDFDDLIACTLSLLDNIDAAWVLYKLDAGIDHILVDEAQDTSRAQWDILRKLAADFLAGEGARSRRRTFFAVGDEKQSIFSFQGAAPAMFDAMRREFKRNHEDARLLFETVSLYLSFRSAPPVLQAVDFVFGDESVWRGVSAGEDKRPPHEAFRTFLPGLVEVWAPIAPETTSDPEDWRMPLDALSLRDPAVALADRIASVVGSWLSSDSKESVIDARSGKPRRIGAGDILILVRKRGPLFEAVTRALRRKGIASAGADRLTLRDHIAVMDLVAAGRAALSKDDDLSLAAVLKSPLIGLDDAALLELAVGRAGPLAAALAAHSDPGFATARARVARWRARAAGLSPFDFYARLLGADGGRRALLERLGPEASDAIDEFMAVALAFERQNSPSLPAFLAEIEASNVAIKRDMEVESAGVRVMTVHASKGLEAPIVFLPDTCSAPGGRHDPAWLDLGAPFPSDPSLFVWATKKGDDSQPIANARVAAQDAAAGEHRRLLYVAMTRAAQRLIIAGYEGVNKRPEDCWYNLIRLGLDPELREHRAPWNPAETIWRLGAGAPTVVDTVPTSLGGAATPEWLSKSPAREFAPVPLAPSHAAPAPRGTGSSRARRKRLEIGLIAHALLQDLPEASPSRRREAAERFLERNGGSLDLSQRAHLAHSILNILASPELGLLFAPGSRAEVAVAGALSRPGRPDLVFSGRIDRLAVTEDEVLVADFKTGPDPGEAPEAYVGQLALYCAMLAPLHPGRAIRAMLIWIETGRIDLIASQALDAAFIRAVDGTQP
jgi:ATP-dependent helicase/nuclease subunit A